MILARDAAKAFFEADLNADRELTFEEFVTVNIPSLDVDPLVATTPSANASGLARTMSMQELRTLFDLVDINHDGVISIQEYFLWVLSTIAHPDADTSFGLLAAIFRWYDKTGEGYLDAAELANAAEDLGFGAMTGDLFVELDVDGSGSIAYHELVEKLRSSATCASPLSRRFLLSLTLRSQRDDAGRLDTAAWQLTTEGVEPLRRQLVELLVAHNPPASGADLFKAMSNDYRRRITRGTLRTAMASIGFPAGRDGDDYEGLLESLWKAMDGDASGFVGTREISDWLNAVARRNQLARELTLRHGSGAGRGAGGAGVDGETGLGEDAGEWTAERLRLALQTALIATELAPVDIFHVYKGRQEAEALTKANFHKMMRKMVDDDALWEAQLKDVTREAYTAMVGTDRVASLVKFQAWLGKGWRENHLHRHKQQQQSDAQRQGRRSAAEPTGERTTSLQTRGTPAYRVAPRRPRSQSVVYRSTLASVVKRNPDALGGEWNEWLEQRKRWVELQARKQYQHRKKCALTVTAVDVSCPKRPPPPPPPLPAALSPWALPRTAAAQPALGTEPLSPGQTAALNAMSQGAVGLLKLERPGTTLVQRSQSAHALVVPAHAHSEPVVARHAAEGTSSLPGPTARGFRREVQTSSASVRTCMRSTAVSQAHSASAGLLGRYYAPNARGATESPHARATSPARFATPHAAGHDVDGREQWVSNLRAPKHGGARRSRRRPAWQESW